LTEIYQSSTLGNEVSKMKIDALYQEIILDHYKHPRNFGPVDRTRAKVHFENPSCGDELDLQINVNESGILDEIRFYGRGCAISQASASMMTEAVKGKALDDVSEYIRGFEAMISGKGQSKVDLQNLMAFEGVSQFPVRAKCALLPWKALRQLLENASVAH